MRIANRHSAPPHKASFIWRFICHGGGLAAVEFGLLLPLMMMLFVGGVELTNMLVANRRVIMTAEVAADLVAQTASISNADMNDVFAASSAILMPYSTEPLSMRISSVVENTSKSTRVAWSDARKTSPRGVNSTVTIPKGLTTPGFSVVMVEVTYAYRPPLSYYLTGTINFTETAYVKPRRAVTISRVN